MVGTSGRACGRILLATASARSLPSLTCGAAVTSEANAMGVWPATVEPIANPELLNGICTRSRPSDSRNCSPTRCAGVPVPAEEVVFAGAGFDEADKVSDRLDRQRRMNRKHQGCADRD